MTGVEGFLESAVRTATPLALAALGEAIAQRAGVINIGLEGIVLAGAFGALVGAGYAGAGGGYVVAIMAGVTLAALFAAFVVKLRADQIIAGTAINLLALGVTGTAYRALYGGAGAGLSIPTSDALVIPLLASVPVVGSALFAQPLPTYLVYAAIPLLWWWARTTRGGLYLRTVGERPEAALVAGVNPGTVRALAIMFGGAMGGLAGATLVLAHTGTFAEGMSAGRGFIAIAIVVLGRWHPGGVALAALIFGGASALQYVFQAAGWELPYHLFLAFPYVLTLLALATVARRTRAPAALGRS